MANKGNNRTPLRGRKQPTPEELVSAISGAFGESGAKPTPPVKDKIGYKKYMDYPMVGYTAGHHFGTSPKKYKNYTEAFAFKLGQLANPKKFHVLRNALNNIKRIHRADGSLDALKQELMKIDEKMNEKAKSFDMNPSIASLLEFGEDLTKKAINGELDECIGREKEIQQMILTLGKKKKANPILTGYAGVGKTQLVHGLANKIAKNEAGFLNDYSIVELSTTDMVAGTKFVGSLQEKMQKIMKAIKECPNVIIFTDEIHNLMGTGKGINGTQDIANILKPMLADGTLKLIGATTKDEYKIIIKDEAMARRFNEIVVKELSVDDTKKVMLACADNYATYHGLDYTNEALVLMPILSKRYAGKNKYLPDSAFDLIDLCGATAKVHGWKDISVAKLMEVASKLYDVPVDEIITEELSAREMKKTIGFI